MKKVGISNLWILKQNPWDLNNYKWKVINYKDAYFFEYYNVDLDHLYFENFKYNFRAIKDFKWKDS